MRVPAAVGVKISDAVQVAFTATVAALHVGDEIEKSPVMVSPGFEKCSGAVPEFFTVTGMAPLDAPWLMLPKFIGDAGVMVTAGFRGAWPDPFKVTLPGALPLMASVAVSEPVVFGVKVAFTMQLPPGAMDASAPQLPVPVSAKSEKLVPDIDVGGLLRIKVPAPILFTVMAMGELVVNCVCPGKLTGLGEMLMTGLVPAELNAPIVQEPVAGRAAPFRSLHNAG